MAALLNLQQAGRVLQDLFEERLKSQTGLSMAEFELLFRLHLAPDHPLQMGEIASQLLNSPSGATRIADRLEKDGLISRQTPAGNRRVVNVSLTPGGLAVLARADTVYREAVHEFFALHLDEGEMNDLRRLMRKLLEGNGAWSDARCSPGLS